MDLDPVILRSLLDDANRRILDLEGHLAIARGNALRYEYECKALRSQLSRMRQDCDTERLHKSPG